MPQLSQTTLSDYSQSFTLSPMLLTDTLQTLFTNIIDNISANRDKLNLVSQESETELNTVIDFVNAMSAGQAIDINTLQSKINSIIQLEQENGDNDFISQMQTLFDELNRRDEAEFFRVTVTNAVDGKVAIDLTPYGFTNISEYQAICKIPTTGDKLITATFKKLSNIAGEVTLRNKDVFQSANISTSFYNPADYNESIDIIVMLFRTSSDKLSASAQKTDGTVESIGDLDLSLYTTTLFEIPVADPILWDNANKSIVENVSTTLFEYFSDINGIADAIAFVDNSNNVPKLRISFTRALAEPSTHIIIVDGSIIQHDTVLLPDTTVIEYTLPAGYKSIQITSKNSSGNIIYNSDLLTVQEMQGLFVYPSVISYIESIPSFNIVKGDITITIKFYIDQNGRLSLLTTNLTGSTLETFNGRVVINDVTTNTTLLSSELNNAVLASGRFIVIDPSITGSTSSSLLFNLFTNIGNTITLTDTVVNEDMFIGTVSTV